MRRANLDFPWRKVGFGTNHRKINDLVLTVDQEVGGSNPPSCTSKINKLGKRGRVCSKSFFGIRCFALESLWNSSKDFRTRCCKINELTLARNQAVRGSRPQPEPGTRTPPQRSRWAYRKRMRFPAHAGSPFGANRSEFARYIQNSDSDAMPAPALVTPTVPKFRGFSGCHQ